MTNLFRKIIARLRAKLTWFRWWIWLRRRVNGRIKLRGSLDRLEIEPSFRCDGDLWLGIYSATGKIRIGRDVRASGPLVVTAINEVDIANDVLIGPNVMITDHYHGDPQLPQTFNIPPSSRALHTRGAIVIAEMVQIGANTSILSPARIGRSAIIGANSVVRGELEGRTIHAGAPARPLKKPRVSNQNP
jgi:acetyltransferase-like isoleucine patch superfamily enzyme